MLLQVAARKEDAPHSMDESTHRDKEKEFKAQRESVRLSEFRQSTARSSTPSEAQAGAIYGPLSLSLSLTYDVTY